MQPNKEALLNIPKESNFEDINTSSIYNVPKIQERIEKDMAFGQFDERIIEAYYPKHKIRYFPIDLLIT